MAKAIAENSKLVGTITGLFLLAGATIVVVGTTFNAFTPDQAKTTVAQADIPAPAPQNN